MESEGYWDVNLTNHLHLVPRLGIHSTTPYMFMAWYLVKHRDNFIISETIVSRS
jgi:hypothetical protein